MPPEDQADDAAKDAILDEALAQLSDAAAEEADDEAPDKDESVDESTDEGDAAASETDDDDTTAEDTDDSEDDDKTDDATVEGRSAFKDLLAKYGGDSEKMAEGVWEQARSVSALQKDLKDVKEMLANQQRTPEDEEKIIASDPEVKEIGGELASLDAEMKNTQQGQTALIAEYGKQDKLIARLEGELDRADELTRTEIAGKLREAKQDMRQVQRDYQSSKQRLESLGLEQRRLIRQYKQVELQARARRDQAKQHELSTREQARLTRDEFNTACRAEAEKYGIDTNSKTFGVLHQSVRDRITGYLRSLPEDAPAIDMPGAVAALMQEYAEVAGLNAKFTKKSHQKRKVTGKTPLGTKVRPKGKVPTDKTGKYWDPAFSRRRAKQLLG
jgi:hypothetical protein